MAVEPSRQFRVSAIAHSLWEQEGRPDGKTYFHWVQAEEIDRQLSESSNQVIYIFDKGIVKFGKFAFALLGVFTLIGAFLWGMDLKEISKTIKDIQADVSKSQVEITNEINLAKKNLSEKSMEISKTADSAKARLDEIDKVAGEARKTMSITGKEITIFDDARVTAVVQRQITTLLSGVISSDKLDLVKKSIQNKSGAYRYTKTEVEQLVRADILKAQEFFTRFGFSKIATDFEINEAESFTNAYFDGKKIVYGMGMVNSDVFGPYDPTVVFHEVAISVASNETQLKYAGQSGAILQSLADIFAVLIEGSGWTIGKVRTPDPSIFQALRSLQSPGSAYNGAVLGKDSQPDHLEGFVKPSNSIEDYNRDVHLNSGILNKAAYLISEGGEHRGVKIGPGIGREKLARLYSSALKRFKLNTDASFLDFKVIVVRAASEVFEADADKLAVQKGFEAVGI